MFLFIDYRPDVTTGEDGKEISRSKLVVGTPIGSSDSAAKPVMAKINSFEGDQADLMYGMIVGVNENGEVKDVETETEKENIE